MCHVILAYCIPLNVFLKMYLLGLFLFILYLRLLNLQKPKIVVGLRKLFCTATLRPPRVTTMTLIWGSVCYITSKSLNRRHLHT